MGVSSLSAFGTLVWHVALAVTVIYISVLFLARWTGVRSFAQLAPFDVAVTVAIGSIIASGAVSSTPQPLKAVVAVATLYALQLFVSRLRRSFRAAEAVTDNRPILLMSEGGHQLPENMTTARVSEEDLRTHLRAANVTDRRRVKAVIMVGTGQIHVMHGDPEKDPLDPWLMENVRGSEDIVATQDRDRDANTRESS